MRLRCEVEDGVDLVLAKHPFDICGRCDVAIFEAEVCLLVEYARIVERSAVVKFVKRYHIIVAWVGKHEMAHEPAGTACR